MFQSNSFDGPGVPNGARKISLFPVQLSYQVSSFV